MTQREDATRSGQEPVWLVRVVLLLVIVGLVIEVAHQVQRHL